MAIVKTPESTKLTIKVQTGTNTSGQAVYRTRTYTNVKATAADSDVFSVAQEIGSLQSYPVHSIDRVDDSILVNQ